MFDRHGVCWGAYQTFAQLLDEDWRVSPTPTRCSATSTSRASARCASAARRWRSAPSTATTHGPAPTLGEHTEQILAEELGLSAGEIAGLRDRGIVAGPA